jgi:hypothetical protein
VEAFNDDFFSWLSRQILAIEDYPYAGIDFSRDLEIPVPPGEERGEMGKSPPIQFFLFAYVIFMSFLIYIMFLYTRVFDG